MHLLCCCIPAADDDKFFVMKALIPLVGRWRHIGSALGLSSATLDTIGQGNQDEAIASLVNKWLSMNYNVDRFPEPSWDALVKAVAEPAGGANRMVAEEIAREYPPELEHGVCVCVYTCVHVWGSSL